MAKLSRSAIAKKAWQTRRMNVEMSAAPPKLIVNMSKAISLSDQLDDSISNLEARLCASIRRINSINKV